MSDIILDLNLYLGLNFNGAKKCNISKKTNKKNELMFEKWLFCDLKA
jgi:hypothetical protein